MPETVHRDYPVEANPDVVSILDRVTAATPAPASARGHLADLLWAAVHTAGEQAIVLLKAPGAKTCAWYRHNASEAWRLVRTELDCDPSDNAQAEAVFKQIGLHDPGADA